MTNDTTAHQKFGNSGSSLRASWRHLIIQKHCVDNEYTRRLPCSKIVYRTRTDAQAAAEELADALGDDMKAPYRCPQGKGIYVHYHLTRVRQRRKG